MSDQKIAYGASVQVTISPASLATSANFAAGRASDAIVNTSNKFLDAKVAGVITVGTTPTTNTQIQIWVYASLNDTPLYPDSITGSDADKTFTSASIRNSSCRLGASIVVDSNTSNRPYPFALFSVASLFGGSLPTHWGIFITHNTAVNLNATPGNHAIYYTPEYGTVT